LDIDFSRDEARFNDRAVIVGNHEVARLDLHNARGRAREVSRYLHSQRDEFTETANTFAITSQKYLKTLLDLFSQRSRTNQSNAQIDGFGSVTGRGVQINLESGLVEHFERPVS
jgi:hypothetical protein